MTSRAATPSCFTTQQIETLTSTLNPLLADVFTLYLKTKNFHWHMNGPHFREYHLMLDDHAEQLFALTDVIAERVRKIGAETICSIGQITRLQRIQDNDQTNLAATAMLEELYHDEAAFLASLRKAHTVCDESNDPATTSLIENWIDESERRLWFLRETLAA